MKPKDQEAFEQCWTWFRTRVEGRLLRRSQQGPLTEIQYSQILRDSLLDWGSDETICGRWLGSLAGREPQKAKEIREILEAVRFEPVPRRRGLPASAAVAAPAAGLGTGLLISHQLHASLAAQTAAALLPAGLLYLSVRSAHTRLEEKLDREQLTGHLAQLEGFHHQILAILEQP